MRLKIDFVAPPFSGHLYPLIELAKPLLARDVDVRFVTGPNQVPFLQSLGLNAVPVLSQLPGAMEAIANTAHPVRSNPIALIRQLRHNLAVLPKIQSDLNALLIEHRPHVIVADFVAVPAGLVSDRLGIPWITTIVTPFALESSSGTPSYLGGLMPGDDWFSRARDFAGRSFVRLFKRFVGLLCRREFRAMGFDLYRPDGTERAYSNYSILGLGMRELEFPRAWPACFKFIGPCCASPQADVALNLPFGNYAKRVLVTIGTHLEWAKATLIEQVSRMAAEFQNVLFVVSFGRPLSLGADPTFAHGNVLAYEYIPYSRYLPLFDVIIHHGGAGVTYNCIEHQKPCLVIPHDYDQFDFAARIEYHKLGVRSRKLGSRESIRGLSSVLRWENMEELARLSSQARLCRPALELEQEIARLTATQLR